MQSSTRLIPYDYQLRLLEAAKEKNVIIALQTGAGKTFIAVMLIRHLSDEVRYKSISNGGKRTVFLVCTVPLVEQQAKVIEQQTDLKVGKYYGNMGVDLWDKYRWIEEFNENEVLVMTAAIFSALLSQDFICLKQINLIIFDECHHAAKNHPYAFIMDKFDSSEKNPKVLGLTASLFNKNIDPKDYNKEVFKLQRTLRSVIETGAYDVTSPRTNDLYIFYSVSETELGTIILEKLTELLNKIRDFIREKKTTTEKLTSVIVDEFCNNSAGMPVSSKYTAKLNDLEYPPTMTDLKKLCNALINILEQLGIIGFVIGADVVYTTVNSARYNGILDPKAREIIAEFLSSILCLKRDVETKTKNLQDFENYVDNPGFPLITNKLYCLTDSIYKQAILSKGCFSCIIFVKMQLIGVVIKEYFARISKNPKYSILKPGFVSGHQSALIPMNWKAQGRIIENFRTKYINVLVATPVIEEGLDIPSCNYVLHFDVPATPSSFIQAKGRARSKNSTYVIMIPQTDLKRHIRTINKFKELEVKLKSSENHSYESPYESDDDERPETVCIGSCILHPSETITFIYKYCAKLSNKEYNYSLPHLLIKKKQGNYQAVLILPRNSPLRSAIIGKECATKKMAKADVCITACKMLYELGEVDENMVPRCLYTKAADETELDGNTCNIGESFLKTTVFTSEIPFPFQQKFQGIFYAYVIVGEIMTLCSGRIYGFVTFGPLPENIPPLQLTVHSHTNVVFVKYLGALPATLHDFEILKKFNRLLYGTRLKSRFKSNNDDAVELKILPCVYRELNEKIGLDRDYINSLLSCDSALFKEINEGCVVQKIYGDKNVFVVKKVDDSLNAMSLFPLNNFTFKQYYERKYNYEIKDVEAPLLAVSRIPHLRDFIGKTATSDRISKGVKIYLVKEMVRPVGLTSELLDFGDILFAVVFRLCSFIRANNVISLISSKVYPEKNILRKRSESKVVQFLHEAHRNVDCTSVLS